MSYIKNKLLNTELELVSAILNMTANISEVHVIIKQGMLHNARKMILAPLNYWQRIFPSCYH